MTKRPDLNRRIAKVLTVLQPYAKARTTRTAGIIERIAKGNYPNKESDLAGVEFPVSFYTSTRDWPWERLTNTAKSLGLLDGRSIEIPDAATAIKLFDALSAEIDDYEREVESRMRHDYDHVTTDKSYDEWAEDEIEGYLLGMHLPADYLAGNLGFDNEHTASVKSKRQADLMRVEDLLFGGDEPLTKDEYKTALRRNVTDAEYAAYVKKFEEGKKKSARAHKVASGDATHINTVADARKYIADKRAQTPGSASLIQSFKMLADTFDGWARAAAGADRKNLVAISKLFRTAYDEEKAAKLDKADAAMKQRTSARTQRRAESEVFSKTSKDGEFTASVEEFDGAGTKLYRVMVRMAMPNGNVGVFKHKRQLPAKNRAIADAESWVRSYNDNANIALLDFTRVASTKRQANPDWTSIVKQFAHAVWVNGYLDAIDEATGEGGRGEHAEVRLESAPWGAGAQLEDYAPDMPAAFVAAIEQTITEAWGKDAILADYVKFNDESGENAKTYGWYLAMQDMGHGVGLSDYGYDSELKQYGSHVEHTYGWLTMPDERTVTFNIEGSGIGHFTADVTEDLLDLVATADAE